MYCDVASSMWVLRRYCDVWHSRLRMSEALLLLCLFVSELRYLYKCWVLNFFLVTLRCPDEISEEIRRFSTFQTSPACTRISNKWYSYDTTLPPWEMNFCSLRCAYRARLPTALYFSFFFWAQLPTVLYFSFFWGRGYPLLFLLSFLGTVTHCSFFIRLGFIVVRSTTPINRKLF